MFIAPMVEDHIPNEFEFLTMTFGDQFLKLLIASNARIHKVTIGSGVAMIAVDGLVVF